MQSIMNIQDTDDTIYFMIILIRLFRLRITAKSFSAIQVEYCMVWFAVLKMLILNQDVKIKVLVPFQYGVQVLNFLVLIYA